MRVRPDPLEQRLDEANLTRAAAGALARRKERPEERRERCTGVKHTEPCRAGDRRPRSDDPFFLLDLVHAP